MLIAIDFIEGENNNEDDSYLLILDTDTDELRWYESLDESERNRVAGVSSKGDFLRDTVPPLVLEAVDDKVKITPSRHASTLPSTGLSFFVPNQSIGMIVGSYVDESVVFSYAFYNGLSTLQQLVIKTSLVRDCNFAIQELNECRLDILQFHVWSYIFKKVRGDSNIGEIRLEYNGVDLLEGVDYSSIKLVCHKEYTYITDGVCVVRLKSDSLCFNYNEARKIVVKNRLSYGGDLSVSPVGLYRLNNSNVKTVLVGNSSLRCVGSTIEELTLHENQKLTLTHSIIKKLVLDCDFNRLFSIEGGYSTIKEVVVTKEYFNSFMRVLEGSLKKLDLIKSGKSCSVRIYELDSFVERISFEESIEDAENKVITAIFSHIDKDATYINDTLMSELNVFRNQFFSEFTNTSFSDFIDSFVGSELADTFEPEELNISYKLPGLESACTVVHYPVFITEFKKVGYSVVDATRELKKGFYRRDFIDNVRETRKTVVKELFSSYLADLYDALTSIKGMSYVIVDSKITVKFSKCKTRHSYSDLRIDYTLDALQKLRRYLQRIEEYEKLELPDGYKYIFGVDINSLPEIKYLIRLDEENRLVFVINEKTRNELSNYYSNLGSSRCEIIDLDSTEITNLIIASEFDYFDISNEVNGNIPSEIGEKGSLRLFSSLRRKITICCNTSQYNTLKNLISRASRLNSSYDSNIMLEKAK